MKIVFTNPLARLKAIVFAMLNQWKLTSTKKKLQLLSIPVAGFLIILISILAVNKIIGDYQQRIEENKLRIVSANIEYGQEEVAINSPVQLNFSKSLEPDVINSLISSIKENLGTEITVNSANNNKTLEIAYANGWKPDSSYNLSLKNNNILAESFSLVFNTIKTPQIIATSIQPKMSQDSEILIAFNQNLFEQNSSLPEVRLEPATKGKIEFISPSVVRFKPDNKFNINTNYKLLVSKTSIKNSAGLELPQDYNYEFRVEANVTNQNSKIADPVYSYYYGNDYIIGIANTVRINTKDPIAVVIQPQLTKESFEANYYLVSGNQRISSTISWVRQTIKELNTKYNSSIEALDTTTPVDVAIITPGSGWTKQAGGSRIVISKNVIDKNGKQPEADIYRTINIVSPLMITSHNLKKDTNILQSDTLYISTNNTILTNTEATNVVKVYSVTDQNKAIDAEIKIDYSSIKIKHRWENGKAYTVKIDTGLQDIYEYNLSYDYTLTFRYEDPDANANTKAFVNIFGEFVAYADNTGEHKVLIEASNVDKVNTEILKLSPQQFMDLYNNYNQYSYDPKTLDSYFAIQSSNVKKFEKEVNNKTGAVNRFEYKLENLDDGIYLIRSISSDGKHRDARLMLLSKYMAMIKQTGNRELFIWINNTQTAEAYANKEITLKTTQKEFKVKTNSEGIATFKFDSEDWQTKFLYSDDGTIMIYNGYELQRGLNSYDYLDYEYYWYGTDELGFMYTDKPVYRAGQEVMYKIFVRNKVDDQLKTDIKPYTVKINNQNNDVIYTHEFTPNEYGTYNSVFKLDENLQSGEYSVYLNDNSRIGDFRIEDYKPFNFKFAAKADLNKIYAPTDKIDLEIDTIYYFGNPVKNATVNVNLYVRDIYYYEMFEDEVFKKFSGYAFPELSMYEYYFNYARYSSQKVASVKAVTDENGKAKLSIPFNISQNIANGFIKSLSLDIEVKDSLGESEFQTLYTKVSPKNGVLTFKSDDYYINTEDAYEAKVSYLNERFAVTPNENILVEVKKQETRQVKRQSMNGLAYWDSFTEEITVDSKTINTGSDGVADYSFKPDIPGSYRVVYKLAKDNKVINSDEFYFYEASYYDYSYSNNSKIELKTNKANYKAGEEMQLTPELPSRNYKGIVTYERNGILEYKIVDFRQNPVIKEILDNKYQPNFYVSVFAFAPKNYGNKYLDYKMGLKEMNVSIDDKYLNIEVKTDKAKYKPREKVNLSIKSSNNTSVEYLVAVVDKAVLDVSKIKHNEGLQERLIKKFWSKWNHGVETFTNLSIYENKIVDETKWGSKGGDGLGGDGGGLRGLQEEDIRKNFKEVAFWLPSQYSKDGNAQFVFDVPDNLTTWEIVVIGITKDTKIAANTTGIVVSKDVNIVSALPIYLYQGDEIIIPYTVSFSAEYSQNHPDMKFSAKLAVNNGELECEKEWKASCNLDSLTTASLPITYKFRPNTEGNAKFSFAITKSNEVLDAEELDVEIYKNKQDKKVVKHSNTKQEEPFKYTFPQGSETSKKTIKVELSDRVFEDFKSIKNYFTDYSNKCSEQTASQIMMLLPYAHEPEISTLIKNGILRLYALQNSDGGWGVWVNNKSINFNTAYVLRALKEAQTAGFDVEETRLNNAISFFETKSDQIDIYDYLEYWRLMADFNKFDVNGLNNYYTELINSNNSYQRLYRNYADIAYIYHKYLEYNKTTDAYIEQNLENIKKILYTNRIVTLDKFFWSEPKEYTYYYYDNDLNSTAVIMYTLLEIDNDNKNLLPGINYLKSKLDGRTYLGSQATFYIYHALKKADEVFNKEGSISKPEVIVNGKKYTKFTKSDNKRVLEIALENNVNAVNIEVKSNKLAYYSVELNYALPFESVKTEQKGISIYSEYKNMDGSAITEVEDIKQYKKDSLYKVDTYVFIQDDLQQSEIHVPIPAGFRAVNFNLANTSEVLSEQVKNDMLYYLLQHAEIRDKEVVFYTGDKIYGNNWRKGMYKLNFLVRANYLGSFSTGGEYINEMYLPGNYAFQSYEHYTVN